MRTVRWVIVRVCLASILASPAYAEEEPESPGFFDSLDLSALPPVRMGGAVTYTFQSIKTAIGQSTMQNTATVTATPSTYIYEPWLAKMNADINLSKSSSSGESSTASNNVTGTVIFNVLPQSDYATDFTYTKFDRSVQLGEVANDLTGQSMRVVNRLNLPDDWAMQNRVSADSSADASGQAEASNEISIDVSKRWVEDQLRVALESRQSTYTGADGATGVSSTDSASVRHRSQPFETVSTDSTSNLRLSSYMQQGLEEKSQVMQGVTTAIWRPQDFYDLTVNGAFRTFQESATVRRLTDVTTSASQTAYGTLATSYVFQPRLIGNLGLNAGYAQQETKTSNPAYAQTESSGKPVDPKSQSFNAGTSAGLDYVSEGEDWAGFTRTWNTGGSADMGMNTLAGMDLNISNHVGHTFSQQFSALWLDAINLSFSQGTGMGLSVTAGSQIPLSHSATFSHSSRSGKSWDVWNLSFSDNREIAGKNAGSYNLANLQITQGFDPDRFSSISINLNMQVYRQVTADTDTGMVDSVSGTITYRERFFLGIENLNFTSDLSFNPPSLITSNRNRDIASAGSSLSSKSQTAATESSGFGSQRWNNRLDYTIGQVRASLNGRATRDTEGMDTILMAQISRRF